MASGGSAVGVAPRALHAFHAIGTLALLATGLLVQWPELRSWAVGGYGREIARAHLWIGWAYLAAPGLVLAAAARPVWAELTHRLSGSERWTWPGFHLLFTLAAAAVLSVSGVLLLLDDWLPLRAWDASRSLHAWVSWAVAASLPLHLWRAGRALAARR